MAKKSLDKRGKLAYNEGERQPKSKPERRKEMVDVRGRLSAAWAALSQARREALDEDPGYQRAMGRWTALSTLREENDPKRMSSRAMTWLWDAETEAYQALRAEEDRVFNASPKWQRALAAWAAYHEAETMLSKDEEEEEEESDDGEWDPFKPEVQEEVPSE